MWIISFPESVDNVHIYKVSCILVKSVHQEWNVVQVVELPAIADEWIAKKILQGDSVVVEFLGKIPYPG